MAATPPHVLGTREEYSAFATAYTWFNQRLFDGKLPPCVVTLPRGRQTYSPPMKTSPDSHDGKKAE